MNILNGSNDKTKDREVQWVTLSQNKQGQWTPQGPFSSSEVKMRMQKGIVKPADYCWQEGWKDWVRIYDEPSFYHSRKPPIEIKTVKKETAIQFHEPQKTQVRFELAEPLTAKKNPHSEEPQKASAKPMLEPWENAKALDFLESTPPSETLNDTTPEELSAESLKVIQVPVEEKINTSSGKAKRFKRITLVATSLLFVALVLDFVFNGQVSQMVKTPDAPIMAVSYISVQDYSLDTPRHLIARTDLKKGQKLVVRLLNMEEKPIQTIKGGAGLLIPSKGTGQIRIPLYPYDLKPGAYKVWVQAEEQEGVEVIKAFVIPDAEMTSSPEA